MKIRKLPSGSYITQIQVDGVRKSFTAKSKKECRRLAMEYAVKRCDASSEPLGNLIDKYIDCKRNVLSPSTIRGYEQIRRAYLPDLMNVPAKNITSEVLQSQINLLSKDHSPKTVRNIYGLVASTMKLYAPSIALSVTLPKKKRILYNIPNTAEVALLVAKSSGELKTAILLAAFCGLRRSEIIALTSSDIHGNSIHVCKGAVHDSDGYTIIKAPKTYQSDRYVTAPDIVLDHIKDINGRICPIGLSTLTRQFIALRKRLHLSCRFHDLRHYYASFQHALGIPDQYIMTAGGWKSDAILKSVYRNTLSDEQRKNNRIINEFLNASIGKLQMKCRQKPNTALCSQMFFTGSSPVAPIEDEEPLNH